MSHYAKQAIGVFATNDAADRAFHRVVDRTVGCSGQTTAMHLDNFTTEVWTYTGGPASATDARLGEAGGRHRPPLLRYDTQAGRTFCCRRKFVNLATAGLR